MNYSSRFDIRPPLIRTVMARPAEEAADPIRVLTFIPYLAIGGSERQVFNIRAGIDRSRFDMHLGCFGYFDEQLAVDLSGTPVATFQVRSLYGFGTIKECLRLAAYLKKHRIDIVHTYNFYANVFALPAARLARTPVVLASIRDTGESLTAKQRAVNRLACRLADRVLVNAEAIKRILVREGYRAERITVIPNGIVCPPPTPAGDRNVHREFGLSPADVLIGVVSRITRLKGLEYFLAAAPAVLSEIPNAKFLIVGDNSFDPDYREELKRQTAQLGLQEQVIFTGFRLDVPNVLSSLSLSVLPSVIGEGLSNSLLESMAAGVPVVATNLGGNPEVVVDGETGVLVPPRDPAALARAICRVLHTPGLRDEMSRAGRRRVLTHFSNDRMIRTVERLYGELLERRRRDATAHGPRR